MLCWKYQLSVINISSVTAFCQFSMFSFLNLPADLSDFYLLLPSLLSPLATQHSLSLISHRVNKRNEVEAFGDF